MSTPPPTADPAADPAPRRRAAGRGMVRAATGAVIVAVALDAVILAVAAMWFAGPELLGALVGSALTLVVVVPTLVTTVLSPFLSPTGMAVTTLASWAGKMVVVVVVLLLVRDSAQVSILWVGIALLVGALSGIALEMLMLVRSRPPLDADAPDVSAERSQGQGSR